MALKHEKMFKLIHKRNTNNNYSKTFSTVRLAKVQKSSNIGLVRFRKTSNYVGRENVNLYNLHGEILVIIIKIKKAYTL